MEQGLAVRVPVQAGAWVEEKARVEAGWADHSLLDRAEIVCVQTVEQQLLMLLDSLVTRKAVLNVVRK